MAAEVETSGIILKTSKSSCVVSVNIDGCTKSFSVSKTIFYVFGVKCEGDLTNLVEEETEVDLSYKLRPGNAPTIVAVWLGEKPELPKDGDRRMPVYDRKGVLNDFIVDTDFGKVYVNRGVTFRDGQREPTVVMKEEVVFDAVPMLGVDFSGAHYEATCAWIGSKPRLVDRFHLDVDVTEDVEFEGDVCGTVVVIPNDVVAFVDVDLDSVVVKVMLFRSSFRRVCDRIQDSVDIGDNICMRVKYGFVFPGRKHWFAVSAMNTGEEVVDEVCDSGAVGSESDDLESNYYCVEDNDVVEAHGMVKTGGDRKSEEAEKFIAVVDLITSLTAGEGGSSTSQAKTGVVADESGLDTTEVRSVDSKEKVSYRSSVKTADQLNSDRSPLKATDQFDSDRSSVKVTDQLDGDKSFAKPTDKFDSDSTTKDTDHLDSDKSCAKAIDPFDKDSLILYSDPALEGVLSYVDPNGCITSGGLKVFLDPCNFYIDGEPCTIDEFALVAKECITVSFEAVLMRRKNENFSKFSHEATCAWIKKKPNLGSIAASLPPPNLLLLEEPKRSFYAKVTKICFPSVALLVIPGESTVSLHIDSFVTKPQYPTKGLCRNLISNYVRLDDWVQFKVMKKHAIRNFVTAHDAGPVFTPEVWAKISPGINLLRGPRNIHTLPSDSRADITPSSLIKTQDASPKQAVCIASPFKMVRLSHDHAYLIDCVGSIRICHDVLREKKFPTVEHVFGSTNITEETVYVSGNKVVPLDTIATRNGRLIHFDAQATMSPNSNAGFVVTRMWETGDARPAPEVVLFSDLKLFEGVTTRCCPAKVISIPLHDTAIASVKGIPILVPLDSLVTLQEVNMAYSTIDTFLSVGDFVGLKFEKRKFPGMLSGAYFRAVSSWSLSKGGEKITVDDEIHIAEPRINSWFGIWGYGQFFCKGKVKVIDDRYFVKYTSKRSGMKMTLDIFEKGKVCYKGELVELEKFNVTDGEAISFHVGHNYVKKVSNDLSRKMFEASGFFAACSWVGPEPVPENCMRGILAVSSGLVFSNRFYEVVVESFPTPTHAICRLGYLPVLVPLYQLTQDGTFVGVEDVNLRRGDRIYVNVLERDVKGKTLLVSNSAKYRRVKDHVYSGVLKNVSGKIITLPNPTGLIRPFNSESEVSFELCNMRRSTKDQNNAMLWLDGLRRKLSCKMKVYFSAVKSEAKTAPYKAFEVFFDES